MQIGESEAVQSELEAIGARRIENEQRENEGVGVKYVVNGQDR